MTETGQNEITPEMAGTWLNGAMGWHNTYRVIDLARDFGFDLSLRDELIVNAYRNSADSVSLEGEILDQAEIGEYAVDISNEATDYLHRRAPEGYAFVWDMGELSLMTVEDADSI